MVGVQRSKACITCLRRKKGVSKRDFSDKFCTFKDPDLVLARKCDKQKPACSQCRKACIECEGYARPRTFVNSFVQDGLQRTTTPPQIQLKIDTSIELVRSGNETCLLGQFWQSYFPNGQALPEVIHGELGGWMHGIQAIYTNESTLRKAVLAITLSTVGSSDKSGGSEWMKEAGRGLYGDALQDAVVMLRNPQKRQGNELLAVVRLFSLFEAVYGEDCDGHLTQSDGWMSHNFGDIALVTGRGPTAFTAGFSHRLFVDGRLHLIITSLKARKKSFLADPSWKTIPWSNAKKTPKDYILDILAEVPSLFETIDAMKSCEKPDTKAKYRDVIRNGYFKLETSLTQWSKTFSRVLIHQGKEYAKTEIITPQLLATTHISTLYWTACLVIYTMIGNVLLEKEGEDLDGRYNDPGIYCRKILEVVPLFFNPAAGIFRVHLVTFPMSIVMVYLAGMPPGSMMEERTLFAKYLRHPACWSIRKLLASTQAENYERISRIDKLESRK